MHPVSYALLWRAYLEDPIIYAGINVTADAIMGGGYKLVGGKRIHKKRIEDLFKENNFTVNIRDTIISLLVFGDAYWEMLREKGGRIREFYPRDSRTIRIDYDENGKVIKYIQRVLHRRVDYLPEEMIHFAMNKVGGRVYGHSSIQPVLSTLYSKLAAEEWNADWFRRGAVARMLYNVKNLSEKQVERIVNKLRGIKAHQDIVLTGDVEATSLAPKNVDMQFKELLGYYRENIIAALGVPPIFLGITEGSNRSSSQSQLEAFDRKVRAWQTAIADKINHQILTKENMGFDTVVFEFADKNKRELLKDSQSAAVLTPLVQMGIVSPDEVRARLGLPPMAEADSNFNYGYDRTEQAYNHNNAMGAADARRLDSRNEGRERQNVDSQMENKQLRKRNPRTNNPFLETDRVRIHSNPHAGREAMLDEVDRVARGRTQGMDNIETPRQIPSGLGRDPESNFEYTNIHQDSQAPKLSAEFRQENKERFDELRLSNPHIPDDEIWHMVWDWYQKERARRKYVKYDGTDQVEDEDIPIQKA